MITFEGYNNVIKKVYDHKQNHVFEYWDILKKSEKKDLLDELAEIDFVQLKKIYGEKELAIDPNFSPAPCISIPKTDGERKKYSEAREIGIDHIKKGKVAAFVVAGGQGSRLGYDGPKGKFPVSPVKNKPLFQIHAEKILKYSKKYGVSIPFLVMTSKENHTETVDFLKKNKFFGLKKKDVIVFSQNMIPSLNAEGKLILQSKNFIFKNPDGHGGSLTALASSGALAEMKKRGVETISYFQIDNPLARIVDPVFIGFHVKQGADISSKACKKAYPKEKVGVFVVFSNGRTGVVEYSDMPDIKSELRDEKGELKFSAGSIAIHLFNREFVERVTAGREISLPFHVAKKKIKSFHGGKNIEIDGFKYEKFVFDALPLTEKNVVFETIREEEFAPVKNPTGIDSLVSSRELMVSLNKKWLAEKGIEIPAGVKILEISPLLAVEPDDLPADVKIPDKEKVYLE